MKKFLEYAYWIVALVEIYAEFTHNQTLRFISKPLLMITLIAFYASSTGTSSIRAHRLMLVAFGFSWVGDVALMLEYLNPNLFLVGLVGFLITHILYIVVFRQVTQQRTALLYEKIWVVTPLVGYMGLLLYALVPAITSNPETKPFMIPVLVYSATIGMMVLAAINRYKRVADISFGLVLGGALLFMISDSIIAINKFLMPLELARVSIMVFYISGQYLIARGVLRQYDTP